MLDIIRVVERGSTSYVWSHTELMIVLEAIYSMRSRQSAYMIESRDATREATPATMIVAWPNFVPVPPEIPIVLLIKIQGAIIAVGDERRRCVDTNLSRPTMALFVKTNSSSRMCFEPLRSKFCSSRRSWDDSADIYQMTRWC